MNGGYGFCLRVHNQNRKAVGSLNRQYQAQGAGHQRVPLWAWIPLIWFFLYDMHSVRVDLRQSYQSVRELQRVREPLSILPHSLRVIPGYKAEVQGPGR